MHMTCTAHGRRSMITATGRIVHRTDPGSADCGSQGVGIGMTGWERDSNGLLRIVRGWETR